MSKTVVAMVTEELSLGWSVVTLLSSYQESCRHLEVPLNILRANILLVLVSGLPAPVWLVRDVRPPKEMFINTNPFAVAVTTLRSPWSLLQDNNTINDPVQNAPRKERRRDESAGSLFPSCIL